MTTPPTALSPPPGTPQTKTKAVVAGVAAGLIAGLAALIPALGANSDGGTDLTRQEAATVALALLIGTGATGTATAYVKNKAIL